MKNWIGLFLFLNVIEVMGKEAMISCRHDDKPCYRMEVLNLSCISSSIQIRFCYNTTPTEVFCKNNPSRQTLIFLQNADDETLKLLPVNNTSGIENFDYFNPKGIPSNLRFRLVYKKGNGRLTRSVRCDISCGNQLSTTKQPSNVSTMSNITTSTKVLPVESNSLVFIIVGSCILILLLLVFGVLFIVRAKNESDDTNPQQQNMENLSLNRLNPSPTLKSKPVKLFLVFAKNNEKHRQVVLNFANFLQADLGFDVMCELFQTLQISVDPVSWMDYCMKQCDKILVVWPPSLIKQTDTAAVPERDLFTPVLKNIRNDLFCGVNLDKYYFCYFDYCSTELIPEDFNASKVYHFHLMNEFEKLYYLLIEMKKYEPGGERKNEKVMIDKLFLNEINKYGPLLQDSLLEMKSYSKANPNWYLENSIAESKQDSLIRSANLTDDHMSSNIIKVSPPPPPTTDQPEISVKAINGDSDSIRDQSLCDSLQTASSMLFDSIESNNKNKHFQTNQMLIKNPDKTDIFIPEQPTKTRIPVVLDQMTNECVTMPFDEEADKIKEHNDILFTPDRNEFSRNFVLSLNIRKPKENSFNKNNLEIVDQNIEEEKLLNKISHPVNHLPIKVSAPPTISQYETFANKMETTTIPSRLKDTTSSGIKKHIARPQLAPMDSKSDPMSSLIALNMLNQNI